MDVFSTKILKYFNGLKKANILDACYIGTNEIITIIPKLNKSYDEKIHIGLSGWHNFDIMCVNNPNRGIILDINSNQVNFMKYTLENISKSNNRQTFVDNIIDQLNKLYFIKYKKLLEIINHELHEKELWNHINFHLNITDDVTYDKYNKILNSYNYDKEEFVEIRHELTRKGSWLSTDNNYNYINKLVLNNKIIVIQENIENYKHFQYLSQMLINNNIDVETLYVSNVHGYINNKNNLIETVKLLTDNNTKIIWSDINLQQKVGNTNSYIKTLIQL